MGHRHFNAVHLIKLANPSAKSVLNVLASHANDYTGRCWPSIERLIEYTGLSRRAVQYAIKEIEAAGLVKIIRGKRRMASAYELTLPEVGVLDQGEGTPPIEIESGIDRAHHAQSDNDNRATTARTTDDRATTAQNRATSAPQQKVTELEERQGPAPPPKPELFMKAWNKLADDTGLPTVRAMTSERKQLVEARQADYPTEDFIKVLDNIEASAFLRGETERWSGCTFDWILKPENFLKILEGTYTNGR